MGPAGLGEAGRPTPVAILREHFALVQARCVLLQGCCLIDLVEISGRPAWFRPPDLSFSQNLFYISLERWIHPSHLNLLGT